MSGTQREIVRRRACVRSLRPCEVILKHLHKSFERWWSTWPLVFFSTLWFRSHFKAIKLWIVFLILCRFLNLTTEFTFLIGSSLLLFPVTSGLQSESILKGAFSSHSAVLQYTIHTHIYTFPFSASILYTHQSNKALLCFRRMGFRIKTNWTSVFSKITQQVTNLTSIRITLIALNYMYYNFLLSTCVLKCVYACVSGGSTSCQLTS